MHPQLAPVRYASVSCNGDRPALYRTGLLLIVLFLFFSCVQKEKDQYSLDEKKKKWEEKISRMDLSVDSLRLLLEESVSVRDDVAISLLCRELGERMRISSDFSDAIAYHQQGLVAAYNIRDTLGITQALNNIGTDFRRIGALPEASDYHYQALQMAESFSGRNGKTGRKNRIMAINGIGNVHLSFGNLDEAGNMFREALSEEKALGSDLGQAINYANIGAVFEEKQRYDSAFFYYQRSMEHNMLAKSQLGIGLCYIHFGHIYELQNEFDKAEREYQLAYDVMNGISDPWHWLEATLAIARIRLHKNDEKESLKYINLSRQAAAEIRSPEHLSKAYHLLHEYNLKRGDFTAALNDFKISKSFEDTIQNIQKLNKVIDMRLNYERNKYRQNIAHLNLRNEMEARQKSTILYASVISVVLLIFSLIALFYAYIQRTNSNKILRKLNRVRTNFFTNVTHEFRTPLTVILGLSNQLQAEKEITPAEMNSYLRAIDRQGTHLLSLVNQLLDMSKIDAGIDNPQWQKGNIVVYVQMVVDSFRLYAKNKNLKLIFLSSEPTIIMDFIPHYIDNILQNLVSNAIKFSSAGSEIFVTTARVNNKFTLKIADAGEGIAKEDLEHVFELFYQGNKTDKNSGSGIGLSYTRQMVEMMNGKIEVESEDKKGSIFTVILPLQHSGVWKSQTRNQNEADISSGMKVFPEIEKSLSPRAGAEPIREGHSKLRPTVLLIEDNEDVLLFVKSFLSAEYNLVMAHDGIEGMELATELIPDIIVTDIMMPNKDGLTLCREIRESALLNHIPIILLTARSTLDDQLKGLKYGADAYIRKPFHSGELLVQMETLLGNRRLLKEKYMRSILKNDATPKKDVNMDFLQKATDIVYSEMHNPHFTVVSLAEKLCISSSQLNRKLSAISGYTPSEFMMRLRIECAKKRLALEDKSIGQIAYDCGFYDIAYFSRTFKRFTQLSPSQYRRLPR